MNNPVYDEIIIVGIILNKKLEWYVANKFLWIMDLEKLPKIEYEYYFGNDELKEVRQDINVISINNIQIFLDRIKIYKADINNLRLKILDKIIEKKEKDEGLEDFYPALLLDFDNMILYSQYPEPFEFENYVPDNWEGKYMSFIDCVNDEDKYWIYKNKNLFF